MLHHLYTSPTSHCHCHVILISIIYLNYSNKKVLLESIPSYNTFSYNIANTQITVLHFYKYNTYPVDYEHYYILNLNNSIGDRYERFIS